MQELTRGNLSSEDRLRLEQLAKDDPFIADALEGYETSEESDHSIVLSLLKDRIHSTKRKRRRWLIPNLTVTSLAALVLVLIGAWVVIKWSNQNAEVRTVIMPPMSKEEAIAEKETMRTVPLENPDLIFPIGGFEGLYTNLEERSKFQLSPVKEGARVYVKVAFKVQSGLHPHSFNILESTGNQAEAIEAVRLIASGPAWKCLTTSPYDCYSAYTVYFK